MIRFITFEGGDGTGKTTQLKALERHLQSKGCSCVSTREPGGTSLGKLIRQVLLEVGKQPIASPTELFLYLADRAQHVQEVILPAIDGGKIVLCDRYTDSTLAYQGYGRGIDLDLLRQLNEFANRGVKPDLTLLLDCPVELGLSRTAQRQSNAGSARGREDRFEREKVEFHEKVRAGFLAMAGAEPERFRIIDASRSVEQVSREIQDVIDREMG
ncbi:MAG TPA: dTMP kinase [Candidatus Binatia bacterium]|nr:dTMP kinase [Candidatus Binatia bacterium]